MTGIILSIMIAAMSAQSTGGQPSRWGDTSSKPAAPQAAQQQAPAAQAAPAPAPQVVVPKSDLPGQEPVVLPPGAVRLEDVKPGTRPQPSQAPATTTAAPSKPAAPAVPPVDPTLYDTRSQPVQQPYSAAPSPAPTAQARPAAPVTGGCKTDLPGGACDQPAVPPGAKRIEDLKPGTTLKPQVGTTAPAAPAPAPAYTPPPSQPAGQYGGHKSDLPGDEPTQIPAGAVRLEDVKPGTRPKQVGAAPAPTAPSTEEFAPPPKPSGKIEEKPVGADEQPAVETKTRQRWN